MSNIRLVLDGMSNNDNNHKFDKNEMKSINTFLNDFGGGIELKNVEVK